MTECKVLAGSFAKVVQVGLGLFSFGVLVMKYSRDQSGRSLMVFCLDSSKQVFAVGLLHILNTLSAVVLGSVLELKATDECTWYWTEIMIDTTLGVLIEYFLLMFLPGLLCGEERAAELMAATYFVKGEFLKCNYIQQLIFWLFIVTIMKISMVIIMIVLSGVLLEGARICLNPFYNNVKLELLVAMIFTPAVMNSVQFWLVDNIFILQRTQGIELNEDQMWHEPCSSISSFASLNSCTNNAPHYQEVLGDQWDDTPQRGYKRFWP
eukprot:TRINITY_DN4324_c0_g2_i1.p1 TRINITY_DN4324_c0_g2~~TRINITY_DN4324_c0_g2_i1.p1  ORF type:complete len:266 (+),score=35.25 TRINITY_DN4324_c0_g2_i1:76-873(+)